MPRKINHLFSVTTLWLALALCLAGCQAAPGPTTPTLTERPALPPASATLASTATLSPQPSRTPRPTLTSRPTYTPTPSETPTATPAPLVWAAPFANPIRLQDFWGLWSPTANEMAGWRGKDTYLIALAEAPKFEPRLAEIETLIIKDQQELEWSPDGKFIVFSGPPANWPEATKEDSALWMMDRQGRHAQRVVPELRGNRWLTVIGWMSPRTVVITDHAGMNCEGIYILDTVLKTIRAGELFCGAVFPPNRDFVPAAFQWYPYYKLYLLGKVPLVKTPVSPMVSSSTYVKRYPRTQPDRNLFYAEWFLDWGAGSSQMLVLQYTMYASPDLLISDEIAARRLVLWDTLTDELQLLYPNGIDGKLSPDGRLLAAVTLEHTTPEGRADSQNPPLSTPETLLPYVHLMDIQSQAVKFSLPVFSDINIDQMYETEMSFSPNSRFLALIGPGPALQGPGGMPIVRIDSRDETFYLNVIEAQSGKVVAAVPCAGGHHWTTPVTPLVWSPSGMRLAYRDRQRNWQMLDLSSGSIQPITVSGGGIVGGAAWSHDERYLLFHQRLEIGMAALLESETYDTFIVEIGK